MGNFPQDSRRWASSKRLREPWRFNGRIIFMSMKNDFVWRENGTTDECIQNSIEVSKYARRFLCGRWSFLGLGSEKTWYKTCSDKQNGNSDRSAEMMILQLHTESCHPIFRAFSAFETGDLESNEHRKKSTQMTLCGEKTTIQKRHGTRLALINQTESWTELQH